MQGDLEGGRTHAPRAARMARALKVDNSAIVECLLASLALLLSYLFNLLATLPLHLSFKVFGLKILTSMFNDEIFL